MIKMKKNIFWFLIVFLILVPGCQETPESEIVRGKIDPGVSLNSTSSLTNGAEDLHPSTVEFSVESDSLSVRVNAEVDTPSIDMISIVEVIPIAISEDTAISLIDSIIGDYALYEKSDIFLSTQEEILEYIIELNNAISNSSDTVEIERFQQYLEDAKEKLKTTPSRSELNFVEKRYTKPDTPLIVLEEGQEGEISEEDLKIIEEANKNALQTRSIKAQAFTNKNIPAYIHIEDFPDYKNSYVTIHNMGQGDGDFDAIPLRPLQANENIQSLTTSYAEAIQMAEQIFAKAGIRDMTLAEALECTDSYSGNQSYYMVFTPDIGGLSATYVDESIIFEKVFDDPTIDFEAFASYWGGSFIQIIIDDSGIIRFEWSAPMKLGNVITESVSLLAFEEIFEVFQRQIVIQNSFQNDYIKKSEFVIDRVVLGAMKVKTANTDDYRYIPVWDFMGYTNHIYIENGIEYQAENRQVGQSFLTISALDGTIIDRRLEY